MESSHRGNTTRHASTSSGTTMSSSSSSCSTGSEEVAPSPSRLSDVERRSFLRAYSRKSLESNPEDEEFVVGDDGTISRIAVDDRARIDRLRKLLDKRERETRQAAEYGLSLLESNEELHLEIESLKIQHEAETQELAADRDLYKRRHELVQQEVESWKSESKRQEELKYQLSSELEKLVTRCECVPKDGGSGSWSSLQRQQQRIQELEASLAEMQSSEAANTARIRSLTQWKTLAESQQRERADVADDEASSEKLYVLKLERDCERLKQQADHLHSETLRLEKESREADETTKKLRTEIDLLHETAKTHWHELHEKEEQLLTAESRCGRLERERAIMEQVANLPVAVYDVDEDEDDDDDDSESDKDDSENEKGTNQELNDPTAEEQWFTPDRDAAHGRRGSSSATPPPPYVPASDTQQRVPPTPSSMATHQKLHHYFHLTALSIIHENNLHEQCFDSSSRSTIDAWYQEVLEQGVMFLGWHAWLINRISAVAATMQSEQEQQQQQQSARSSGRRGKLDSIVGSSLSTAPAASSSANSPFRAFMKRRQSNTQAPSLQPPATPRVSSSVAWSFFSRLMGGRSDNQDDGTTTTTATTTTTTNSAE